MKKDYFDVVERENPLRQPTNNKPNNDYEYIRKNDDHDIHQKRDKS